MRWGVPSSDVATKHFQTGTRDASGVTTIEFRGRGTVEVEIDIGEGIVCTQGPEVRASKGKIKPLIPHSEQRK